MSLDYEEKEIEIGMIESLLRDGYSVQVDSPDGWIDVNFFIDKGNFQEYTLIDTLTNDVVVRCNADHLFQTHEGWKSAKHLNGKGPVPILTEAGFSTFEVKITDNIIPIVDINVNHENHRYYTNGVSSHNTGVGKSLFMCHCAAANLLKGYNVLYITLEMAEERIAERIAANLLDVTVDELSILPKTAFDKKMERVQSQTVGKLIIKEYPTVSASVQHFRHLLNELKMKKNFVPSIIYIDYLNICASSRIKAGSNVNSYSYIKAIAEEIRGLAVEHNLPIVSATQTNRGGSTSTDVDLTDTSDSFGLPMTVDFMFALISTEELQELNQIMVKQLKNRYNDPTFNRRFVVGVDRAKMRLYDTEQSAQDDIRDGPVFDKSSMSERLQEDDGDFKKKLRRLIV